MNAITENAWGWFYETEVTNGPSGVWQACFIVINIQGLYPMQIAVGNKIAARRYISGSWGAWV